MPPRLAATFQKVNLSGYSDGYGGLTANQAAPKGYIDQVIADLNIPDAGVDEAFVNAAISTERTAERIVRVAAENAVLASANTAAAGLIATESSARVAASLAETNIRVAAEAQVLAQALADAHADMISFVNEEQEERTAADNDIRSYVSGAISTIISGGTATLQALDTINNIYAAITGDSSGVVSGLLFTKANLATPNTFTAANTFASGLTISGSSQYLYFGTNWRVGGNGPDLKFQYAAAGDFASASEIVFTAEEPVVVVAPTATLSANGTSITATFTGAATATLTKPDGTTVTINSSGEIVVADVTGDYTLTVTNSAGTVISTPVTVTVAEVIPTVTASLSVSGLTLTVSFTGADSAILTAPDNSTQTVSNNASFSNSAAGTYSLTVVDPANTANTATATAEVVILQITDFSQSVLGNNLTFSVAFTPADSSASLDQGNQGVATIPSGSLIITAPADPQTYILTVSNSLYDPSSVTQSLAVSGSGLTITDFVADIISGQVTFTATYAEPGGAVLMVTPGDLQIVSGTTISIAQPETAQEYTLTLTKENYFTRTMTITVQGSLPSP